MSRTVWNVPLVTPSGNPANVGVVVATPAEIPKGVQQWMCDAVVPLVRPLNVTSTASRLSGTSTVTRATPVAVEVSRGLFSCALFNVKEKLIGVACAAVASNRIAPASRADA